MLALRRGAALMLTASLTIELVHSCRGATALDFAALMAEERRKMKQAPARAPAVLDPGPRAPLDRQRHALTMLSGAFYIPDFVSAQEEERILAAVAASDEPWQDMGMRRLQRHGGVPCAVEGMAPEPFPPALDEIRAAVAGAGIGADFAPDFLLLNEYREGSGISRHKDGELYRGRVAVLSLASTAQLDFWRHKQPREGEKVRPGSSTRTRRGRRRADADGGPRAGAA
jgi:alkylated DNA repair dioxygenase AlkB